ncbi:hypothetical protein E2R56_16840 [Rhodococcus qingshengii]|nr:hypothetical protein E2R56_16840 [Rhodococcus qingshengii]
MKRSNFFCVSVLVFLLTVTQSVLAYSNDDFSLNKQTFQSADYFYNKNVDKKDYKEFIDSDLKVRKLIMVKDLPKVFDEKEWTNYPYAWKKHLKKAIIGNTKKFNPEQQVYYFSSLKDDGEKINIQFAIYDAKTKKIRSQGGGHWTKEEFERKFEQK